MSLKTFLNQHETLSRSILRHINGGGANKMKDICPEVGCTFSCDLSYCVCDNFNHYPGMCVNR